MSRQRLATGDTHQARFAFTIQHPRTLAPLQCRREALAHTVGEFAPPCDSYNPPAPLLVDQAVSAFTFVRPQQHLGMTATIGGLLPSSLHQTFQLLTLYPAQSHHITFLQG